jgi:hypothetical protein
MFVYDGTVPEFYPIFLSVPDPEHSRFLVTTNFELQP